MLLELVLELELHLGRIFTFTCEAETKKDIERLVAWVGAICTEPTEE